MTPLMYTPSGTQGSITPFLNLKVFSGGGGDPLHSRELGQEILDFLTRSLWQLLVCTFAAQV